MNETNTSPGITLEQIKLERQVKECMRQERLLKALAAHLGKTFNSSEWGGVSIDTAFLALVLQNPTQRIANIGSYRSAVNGS